jgi:hypothetical protein
MVPRKGAKLLRPCGRKVLIPKGMSDSLGLPGLLTGLDLWRRGDAGFFRDLRKASRVFHSHVRENFAVQRDAGYFHAVDQLAIGQSSQTSGGTDALNPQAAVLALLDAAISERIAIGAIGGFLSRLVQLALGEEKSLCPLEILLTPGSAFSAAFYAWHGFSPSNFRETKRVAARRKDTENAFRATGLFPV